MAKWTDTVLYTTGLYCVQTLCAVIWGVYEMVRMMVIWQAAGVNLFWPCLMERLDCVALHWRWLWCIGITAKLGRQQTVSGWGCRLFPHGRCVGKKARGNNRRSACATVDLSDSSLPVPPVFPVYGERGHLAFGQLWLARMNLREGKGGRLKYGEDMEVGYVVYPRGDIIRSTRLYSYYRLQLGKRGGSGLDLHQ